MRHFIPLLVVPALVILSVSQTGCGNDAKSMDSEGAEDEEVVPGVPVEAASVVEGEIAAFFSGTATLEADDEAMVVAKAGGIVTDIFVEEGDFVERGQPLAKLDDERLSLEVARTEATLRQLQRQYERAQGTKVQDVDRFYERHGPNLASFVLTIPSLMETQSPAQRPDHQAPGLQRARCA